MVEGAPPSPGALLDAFEEGDPLRAFLGKLSVAGHYTDEIERRADDCRNRLELRSLEREMESVMTEMRKAKARGDASGVREYGQRKLELRKGIEALTAPKQVL